jgi:hypothetical protein
MLASSLHAGASAGGPHGKPVTRLLVTWQDPTTRTYRPVGILERTAHGYEFAYLRSAASIEGFRPFLGFRRFEHRYRSTTLFPLFAGRVMDPSRPDRPAWLNALALDETATPMEVLAHSGGHRPGDTIELLPLPSAALDGRTACTFLVHGVRHQPGAPERIARLSEGERLSLREDSSNPVNSQALLVIADNDQEPLGWVPDPLVQYVHEVRSNPEHELTVVRANPPDVGPHLQLLVQLRGRVSPASPIFGPLRTQLAA